MRGAGSRISLVGGARHSAIRPPNFAAVPEGPAYGTADRNEPGMGTEDIGVGPHRGRRQAEKGHRGTNVDK